MDDGQQVIDILARHPSTAHFISLSLAKRFVADNPPPSLVERMAEDLYALRWRPSRSDAQHVDLT